VKLLVLGSFPEAALMLGLRGSEAWLVGSGPLLCGFPGMVGLSLSCRCFSLAGERLKGPEGELASAVESGKQEGSDSD